MTGKPTDQASFLQYVADPEQASELNDTRSLIQLIQQYPYFQSAHLLLGIAYYHQKPDRFYQALSTIALNINDRAQLYRLLHEQQAHALSNRQELHELDQLIQQSAPTLTPDSILGSLQQQEESRDTEQPTAEANADNQPQSSERAILDAFLTNYDHGLFNRKRPAGEETSQRSASEDDQSADRRQPELTEANARVLEARGELKKAVEIYEKLSLQHPQNFNYFVEQAENLKHHNR